MSLIETRHIIDCDAEPFVPPGMEVIEHIRGGQIEWGMAKVRLYLDKTQIRGGVINGYELRRKLFPVLANATILDYLLVHPDLIPKAWKKKLVHFPGTIYRERLDERRCIRYLYWNGTRWRSDYRWLDSNFDCHSQMAEISVP